MKVAAVMAMLSSFAPNAVAGLANALVVVDVASVLVVLGLLMLDVI